MNKYLAIIILLLGAFLRLYRLPQTMQFLGDQGRDVFTVRRMLIEHHPVLIGPVTSVGNMYLGPFYYYFMLFPYMLTYPDPTGPAYAVALVGILTVWLVYKLGKEMVGEKAALFASFTFAISPLVLTFSRFSWNPNIVPLFSLLLLWSLYNALKGKDKAWIWVGLWFAVLMQLHYITLLLGGLAGLIWIYVLIGKLRAGGVKRSFVVSTLAAIVVFLISLIPLVAFDFRHEFINSRAFLSFFQGTGGGHFNLMTSILARLVTNVGIFVRSLTGLFVINAVSWGKLVILLALLSGLIWRFRHKHAHTLGERLVVFTLLFSVFGLSFYRGTLFDHYLAFLFPVASIFIGMFLSWVWEKKQIKLLVIPPLAVMIIAAGINFPGKQNLGYNIYMMKRTAVEIEKRLVPGEKYNIFLISPSNDVQGLNYRYFLTVDNKAPESETEFFNFSTLYVLQDIPEDKLTFSSHYMFAIWPNRNVVDSFSIPGGPRIYVLKR